MQEAEDHGEFRVFAHSIGDAHTCVQAGERRADECDDNGNR